MTHVTDGLRSAVRREPDGVATLCAARRRTWRELADRVARIAGGLRGLGVGAGDRVAIWALNADRYIDVLYAVPWAGGVVVPLNTRLAPVEIRAMVDDAEVTALIVDEMSAGLLEPTFGPGPRPSIVFMGEAATPPGLVDIETLAAAEPVEDALRGGEDLYGIFYTGGTTGRAKGVMLSHRNVLANAANIQGLVDRLGLMTDHQVYLHVAPMFHLGDLGGTFRLTEQAGTHATVPRFDPAETLRAIAEFRITSVMMVPTMLNMILQLPDLLSYDVSCLESITYGASPMPPAVMKRALAAFPRVRFLQGYGMTELSPVATFLEPDYHVLEGPLAGKLASAGRPIGTVELRVVDGCDRPVPVGVVGEVVVRGPMVMQGYWRQPETTAAAIRDGWMHTGDAGYLDEDGFLFVVDRVKDMIITGGENVYSVEVESALYAHPAVAMCAVFGVPDDEWGEAVHATVVLKPGHAATEAELIEFARGRIAHYKCPRAISFRAEPLPLSGAGKILKSELRAPYWAGRSRRVN